MPSSHKIGRKIPLSPARRLVNDVVRLARSIPSIPVERHMNLQPLLTARQSLASRPSWYSVFLKAFALTARSFPELRRSYLTYPFPSLYEHPVSIASVAIERQFGDEAGVLFGRIYEPSDTLLVTIDQQLREWKEAPVESIYRFQRALQFAKLPWFVRRLMLWFGMHSSGARRARQFGTFGISAYSGLGAQSLHPISPLTCLLNYGPIDSEGNVCVRIIYDHRVMDGSTIARALISLEETLNGEIRAELLDTDAFWQDAQGSGSPIKMANRKEGLLHGKRVAR